MSRSRCWPNHGSREDDRAAAVMSFRLRSCGLPTLLKRVGFT